MGVIIQPNTNVVELFGKFVLDGASTKESCSAVQTQNETPVSHGDPLKILVWLIMDVKDVMFFQLEHVPNVEFFYLYHKNVRYFVFGNE